MGAADHLGIEILHHDLLVSGIVVVLLGFKSIELRDLFGGEQVLLEGGGALEVGLGSGGHIGDDETAEMLLVVERVLDGEDASPGVAVEYEVFEAEAAADLFDLLRVSREGPEARGRRVDRSCRSRADRSSSTRCRQREGRTP